MTDIPPMTRKLTYTLSTSGVTRDELVSPETVSKSQPEVFPKTEGVDTNSELNVKKEKVQF